MEKKYISPWTRIVFFEQDTNFMASTWDGTGEDLDPIEEGW